MPITGSLTHGYTNAYKYYKALKDKMLDQVVTNIQLNGLLKGGYDSMKSEVETNILSNVSSYWEGRSAALDALDAMEEYVKQMIANQDISGVRNLMQELTSQASAKNGEITQQTQALKAALKANQTLIFSQLGIDQSILLNAIKTTTGDTTDILNQLSSYFIRYLYNQLFAQFQISSRFKYEMALAGFYKEATEYEVLSEHLSKVINVFHAGSHNTELDIIITSLDNMEAALEGNTSITKIITAGDFSDIEQDLVSKIEWFGEQVKSWSLNSNQKTYHIGNRADLFKAYLTEKGVNEDYSTADSARFLARFENILLALGPTNVLFSSNNNRQWMCDFIFDFRMKNYFLAFGRSTDKSPLTPAVNLEQYFTEKKNIRKRFAET